MSPGSARPSSELARYYEYDASEGRGGVGHPPDLNLRQRTPPRSPGPCSLSPGIRAHTACTAYTAHRVHTELGCAHPALASRGPGFSISCPPLQCRGCGLTFLPCWPWEITLGSLCGEDYGWAVCNISALKYSSRISQPPLLSLAVAGAGLGHSGCPTFGELLEGYTPRAASSSGVPGLLVEEEPQVLTRAGGVDL